ncbi:hypothetical protein ABZP36_024830 [Zizania latifolia]
MPTTWSPIEAEETATTATPIAPPIKRYKVQAHGANAMVDDEGNSMMSVIERYNEANEDPHLTMNASSEAKFWQLEASSLRQQLHNLQEYHRQCLGQQLSGLAVEDLQNLDNKLEMSLRNIRLKKDNVMIDQIQELNRKGIIIHQENMELHQKLCLVHQEKINLQKKIRERRRGEGSPEASWRDAESLPMEAVVTHSGDNGPSRWRQQQFLTVEKTAAIPNSRDTSGDPSWWR